MGRTRASTARQERGNVERRGDGSLRVRVYAGKDTRTGRDLYLRKTIQAGPDLENRAHTELRKLVRQVEDGKQPRTNATVNELLDEHLAHADLAKTSRRAYGSYLKKHIRPLLGKKRVGQLNAKVLDDFYLELRRCHEHCDGVAGRIDHRTVGRHQCDGRCTPHTCKPLADWSILKIHYLLSAAYERAVRWEWVGMNPMVTAEPPSPPPPDPRPPTVGEAAKILEAAWKLDFAFGVLVWITMTTGARRGDICGVRWRHFDADRGTLYYFRAIAQDGANIEEKENKNQRRRNIALDSETVRMLGEYRQHLEDIAASVGSKMAADAFMFSNDPQGLYPLKPRSLGQRYSRLVERLGIETSIHKLRHYSATELITAGVDVRTVAGRLGHSGNGATTLKFYTAWVSEADQRASRALAENIPVRPPRPERDPVARAKIEPTYQYEQIAYTLRLKLRSGMIPPGTHVPTAAKLAAEHGVVISTARRVIGLLRAWELVSPSVPGQRSVFLADAETVDEKRPAVESVAPTPGGATAPSEATDLGIELRLYHEGDLVKCFHTRLDPSDTAKIEKLFAAKVRQHAGNSAELIEYEMEIRTLKDQTLVRTFVSA